MVGDGVWIFYRREGIDAMVGVQDIGDDKWIQW